MNKLLTVVIPCFNEEKTINKIIKLVYDVNLSNTDLEVIVIDDFSSDNTRKILTQIKKDYKNLKIILQEKNFGKGQALKRGFKEAKGDYVIVQDADLEYVPSDYLKLLKVFNERENVVAVFGSRFIGDGPRIVLSNLQVVANKIMTMYSNFLSGIYLTDIHTCYIMIKKDKLNQIIPFLKSARFGFNPEIVALLAKSKSVIAEVGIQYYARTKSEGKKIKFKDGIKAFWEITKYNLIPIKI